MFFVCLYIINEKLFGPNYVKYNMNLFLTGQVLICIIWANRIKTYQNKFYQWSKI